MDTKTALLDAAEHIARKRGFDGFSYADLADVVGIRKASIHHHFPTKAALGRAMMERYRVAFGVALRDIAQTGKTAGEQMRDYVGLYRNALKGGETVCLCVALASDRNNLDDATLAEVARFHDESLRWLETLFGRAAQDRTIAASNAPAQEAAACLALIEGAQLMAHAIHDVSQFDLAVSLLLSRIIPAS